MKGHIIDQEDIEFTLDEIRTGQSDRGYRYYKKLFGHIPNDTDRFTQLNDISYLAYKDENKLQRFLKIIEANKITYEFGYLNTYKGKYKVLRYKIPYDFD